MPMDGFVPEKHLNNGGIRSLKTMSDSLENQSEEFASKIREVETSIELQITEIYKRNEMDYPK